MSEVDPLRHTMMELSPAPEEAVSGDEALLQAQEARLKTVEEIRRLREEIERLNRQLDRHDQMVQAVREIHTLFDHERFIDLENHLDLLKKAGIEGVKIGGRTYPLSMIIDKVSLARQNVDGYLSLPGGRRTADPEPDESAIGEFLAQNLGVTRGKISERSASGFRNCLLSCMVHRFRHAVIR